MLLFIPRSLCALKRVAAKVEHAKFGATMGIRIALASGVYRAEATDGRRAMVVQGLVPGEEPPWPGFKDLPDDAFETVILPRDLERGAKVGDDFLRQRFDSVGIATQGDNVSLGLGSELVTARTVEGRFPSIDKVIPRRRPLFTFCVDPKTLAETLPAIADLLPDESRSVQVFFYGKDTPIGICAQNVVDHFVLKNEHVLVANVPRLVRQARDQLCNLVAVLLDLVVLGVDVPPKMPFALSSRTRSLEVEEHAVAFFSPQP